MLSIRKELPNDYKLLVDFKSSGNCKLYSKDDSYMCTLIVPWFDENQILYIQIDSSKEQLQKRRKPPLGFKKSEVNIFSNLLINLCDSINNGLDEETTHLNKMHIEYVSMPFWANSAIMYINKKSEWDATCYLLYSLSQIIYVAFGVTQTNLIEQMIDKKIKEANIEEDIINISKKIEKLDI